MTFWTERPELHAAVLAASGTHAEIAKKYGLTRAQVNGVKQRQKKPRAKRKRNEPRRYKAPGFEDGRTPNGDWDTKLFEPYAQFKERKRAERAAQCR